MHANTPDKKSLELNNVLFDPCSFPVQRHRPGLGLKSWEGGSVCGEAWVLGYTAGRVLRLQPGPCIVPVADIGERWGKHRLGSLGQAHLPPITVA